MFMCDSRPNGEASRLGQIFIYEPNVDIIWLCNKCRKFELFLHFPGKSYTSSSRSVLPFTPHEGIFRL